MIILSGIIELILKDTKYDHPLFFTAKEKIELEQNINEKNGKYYVKCQIREKEILLKPEEVIRQLYLIRLMKRYGYPKNRIRLEHKVNFGREVKFADIVVFDRLRPTVEYIIVEIKKPKLLDGKNQLRSYCNATGAPIGVWTNGGQISHYNRKDPNYFEDLTDIPNANQTLEDILKERFTLVDLMLKDKIMNGKSLKSIVQEMENEVLSNAGVDVFEETFKLIFTKIFDEVKRLEDRVVLNRAIKREIGNDFGNFNKLREVLTNLKQQEFDGDFEVLEFRNTGQPDIDLKKKIQMLFDEAIKAWPGVFEKETKILLSPSHLSICVSSLQDIKLYNSNLLVIDDAFEYLVNKSSKGEKGQYFTIRHVIDMVVKMLNPKIGESMIDTSSGSCGFPVHTLFYMIGGLFTHHELSKEDRKVAKGIFGIDFDERAVRVARTLFLIAGFEEHNVLHLNTLDYERWAEFTTDPAWLSTYGKALNRLQEFAADNTSYKEYQFDIAMGNPPFAGDIKESRIIHKYELGFNKKGKPQNKVSRDVLFIERNLDFLKPGGRMALVLPQGRFNNTTEKELREMIEERARIIAVVGLDVNSFKPHTGTKTSVLFLQKWNDNPTVGPLCPKVNGMDYPIFFAVSEKSGKDNSGEYIFKKDEDGSLKVDRNGQLIIDHDLHNHGGELEDGIAEAFIEWAKSEGLSFWMEDN